MCISQVLFSVFIISEEIDVCSFLILYNMQTTLQCCLQFFESEAKQISHIALVLSFQISGLDPSPHCFCFKITALFRCDSHTVPFTCWKSTVVQWFLAYSELFCHQHSRFQSLVLPAPPPPSRSTPVCSHSPPPPRQPHATSDVSLWICFFRTFRISGVLKYVVLCD